MYQLDKISSQFPYSTQNTYLNTPAYGLLSESLLEWRQEHDLDHLVGGSRFKERFFEVIASLRSSVATFTSSATDEVFLVPNFSFGWKVLIGGLPKDKHVLLLNGDYPSLNWPVITANFEKLEKIDVSFSMEDEIEEYFSRHAPDIFAFSIVQYLNGVKINLDLIKRLKARYPNTLFMADATQYLGTETFQFFDSGIDVLGVSGYKWLLAGTGNGFFLVKKEVQSVFYSSTVKWEPRMEPWLKHNTHLQNHLEPGHLDSMSMGSLHHAIGLLEQTGMPLIEEKIKKVCDYAREHLLGLGFLEEELCGRSAHGTFYAIKVTDKQLSVLSERRVDFAIRGGRLRIGFHFYNSLKDVDAVVNVLKHT
ncbi:aminotransferase class V-fold PLP-dependent enzyme [Robertkochia marina]|uniref:Aminotransferase class V-fold PLP-dependent enzyme n=1 Tax=Robertkochia marina TaxID=1227945 RepID=A0A4S3M2N4_9FLAO|nr:aminotransferase class V-fold PLP-dependent enzyme [Robertkochia marina]THD68939.1 aminotransferase class V-fold PLP-dependent enzyme [Robertkochia marina]TRZ44760.1 aminotransferase class V-fold PLP-dependent enzyme [Robertkochia marina]